MSLLSYVGWVGSAIDWANLDISDNTALYLDSPLAIISVGEGKKLLKNAQDHVVAAHTKFIKKNAASKSIILDLFFSFEE